MGVLLIGFHNTEEMPLSILSVDSLRPDQTA